MKVTNIKTNETYELSADDAAKLNKSPMAKRFKFEKPAGVPSEIAKPAKIDEPVKPAQAKKPAALATDVKEQ